MRGGAKAAVGTRPSVPGRDVSFLFRLGLRGLRWQLRGVFQGAMGCPREREIYIHWGLKDPLGVGSSSRRLHLPIQAHQNHGLNMYIVDCQLDSTQKATRLGWLNLELTPSVQAEKARN